MGESAPRSMPVLRSSSQEKSPTAERIQAKFELGVSVALFSWPALSLAVQNQWGGPDSEGKREWLAGAIIDLFQQRPRTDLEDVETILLEVMLDEFEVNVDDQSAYEVAKQIMQLREATLAGDFTAVDAAHESWLARKGKTGAKFTEVKQALDGPGTNSDDDGLGEEEEEEEEDDDDDDLESEDGGDLDVHMDDAPDMPLGPLLTRAATEVDEEGFTKVVGKKKR